MDSRVSEAVKSLNFAAGVFWFESRLHRVDSCVTSHLTCTSLSLCTLICEMKERNPSFMEVMGRIKCEVTTKHLVGAQLKRRLF